jgi:hypothetical protein
MTDRTSPEDDEPIALEHEDVLDRLEAFRRRTATATEELVDLTLLEPHAELIVLPEADAPPNG